jgi:tRNA pseudouridine13 synthase
VPRIKAAPEDFFVEELPLYAPSGKGEHAWVEVEKRQRTTEEVAGELATAAGVDPGRVGWAGRKDREAVARQWLSVPGLSPARAATLAGDGWRVLQAAAHGERLRLGELRANHFRLVVRDVDAAAGAFAAARLMEVARHGLPNLFGAQRFGGRTAADGYADLPEHERSNVVHGAALLRGEPVPGGRRHQRLYLSALQSALFNEVLRTRPAPPHVLLPGDLALVHGSGALLHVGSPALRGPEAEERAVRFEVSPTGPLIGHKMRPPRGEALAREQAAAARLGVPWIPELPRLPAHLLPGVRRPLRAAVLEASLRPLDDDAVVVDVVLPPGTYATVLAAELFPGLA